MPSWKSLNLSIAVL